MQARHGDPINSGDSTFELVPLDTVSAGSVPTYGAQPAIFYPFVTLVPVTAPVILSGEWPS